VAIDLYTRGALAEVFAFVWLPLVLRFARGVRNGRESALPLLAATYGALALTHLPTMMIFSPVAIAYVFLTAPRGGRLRALSKTLAALALGAGAAAIYLLPALTMQGFVSMSEMRAYAYQNQWVYSVNEGVRSAAGRILWSVITTTLLAVGAYLLTRTRFARIGERATRESGGGEERSAVVDEGVGEGGREEGTFWIAAAGLSVLMMTPASAPVWRWLTSLQRIQFPWRFNAVLCVAAAALVALATREIGARRARLRRLALGLACAIFAAWLALDAYSAWRAYGDRDAAAFERSLRGSVAAGVDVPEYRPAWAASNNIDRLSALVRRPCAEGGETAAACVVGGDGSVVVERWRPREIVLRVSSVKGATLIVRQFYFPYWSARADGRAQTLKPTVPDGLVTLDVPPGEGRIEITLQSAPAERAGQLVSAASCCVLLIVAFSSRRRILSVTSR
jgi:hypothetical protein